MQVFISWSGERSGRIAEALKNWLPKVVQAIRPWISSSSIEAGTRWNEELTAALADLKFGILCLTPENVAAPWVLFEAGALAKSVTKARVVPYLVGIDAREIQGPLAQFMAVKADELGTLSLLRSLNSAGGSPALSSDLLTEAFHVWWSRLQPIISEVLATTPPEPIQPKRTQDEMLGEVLEILRRRPDQEVRQETHASLLRPPTGSTLGERVYYYRGLNGLSQSKLGELANVSNSYISNVENGRYFPAGQTLSRLATALGVQAADLVDEQ